MDTHSLFRRARGLEGSKHPEAGPASANLKFMSANRLSEPDPQPWKLPYESLYAAEEWRRKEAERLDGESTERA